LTMYVGSGEPLIFFLVHVSDKANLAYDTQS
jgi:hypothetical protein